MTATQFIFALFVLLLIGIALPLPYAVRMGLVLALVALSVLTFIGSSMRFLMTMF